MNLPDGYPHRVPDEEILRVLGELADDIYRSGADINVMLQLGPLFHVGQSELNSRNAKRGSEELRDVIETFRTASDRASNRLIILTGVLVALTAVLAVATIALLVNA